MKRISILLCLMSFFSLSFANEKIHSFLKNLPKDQSVALDWFFRNCLQSFGGYVLCGDKPMCIEEIAKGKSQFNHSEWGYAKITAFQTLKDWNSNHENEYIFLFCNYYNYYHMLIINRQAFIDVINKNLSLFRYILGRTLTAESLLEELIKNQNQFWDLVKAEGNFLDFEEFCTELDSPGTKAFKDVREKEEFIFGFKKQLFVNQYENGKVPQFPCSWF